jgi:hypothetical protein
MGKDTGDIPVKLDFRKKCMSLSLREDETKKHYPIAIYQD